MSTLLIPLTNAPWAECAVTLEGVTYTLETRWNTRAAARFLTILDADGVVLKSGIKVVVNVPFTGYRDTNPSLPPGQLWAIDSSGQNLDPTLADLGTRVVLVYEESA